MPESISFTVNGRAVRLTTDLGRPLLWVLRADLGLTGTKYGCGEGLCGACTVLVADEPVRSCQTPLKAVRGKDIVTIEGLARGADLHPLQQAFIDHEAMQCGFCTPGMILAAYGLLRKNPRPTREDIVRGLDDNLCRCGSHTRVLRAVEAAAGKMKRAGR
ncbi:MAG: (2Fe-2S)-binding protein [Candidatus Aminicenantes bacterium]|nr:(2Fe-2S)-binding protein [Candidatus Aminicenantes bacterium]